MSTRRRLLISNNINVRSLVFSYTDTFDDEITTIGGRQYRLLTFLKNGTLTLDRRMLGRIPYDIWVVAGGGQSGPGSTSNWHSICSTYPDSGFGALGGSWHGCDVGCDIQNGNANYGKSGGDGGWSQISRHKSMVNTLVIDTGAGNNSITEDGNILVSAEKGGDATSGSVGVDKTRDGDAWFELSASNNGDGGSGSGSFSTTRCSTHGVYAGSEAPVASGKPGVVYIRIPLKY